MRVGVFVGVLVAPPAVGVEVGVQTVLVFTRKMALTMAWFTEGANFRSISPVVTVTITV